MTKPGTLRAHVNVVSFPTKARTLSVDRKLIVAYSRHVSDLSPDNAEETTMSALRRVRETPQTLLPAGAPTDAIKRDFGRRLYRLMKDKGWNQSELARAAAKHMADGEFGRDNVSGYIRGLRLPGSVHLTALAKALGVGANELLASHATAPADKSTPEFDMKSIGDGMVWMRVNQAVQWDTAAKIMALLKDDT